MRGYIEVYILEIIVAKKVSFCSLDPPMNPPNLPAGDEEVFQLLLPMRVGIMFPDGCDRMNEAL